jgi:hypothetical protein
MSHSAPIRSWVTLLCIFLARLPAAAQTPPRPSVNFTVAPPPLGYPAYASALVDQVEEREEVSIFSAGVSGGLLIITGDEVSLKGGGVFATPRIAFGPGAVTVAVGVARLGGEAADLEIGVWAVDGQLGLELNVLETPTLRAVAFAGYDVAWSYSWFTIEGLYYAGAEVNTGVNVTSIVHGPQLGAQVHVLAPGSFIITPFVIAKNIGGESDPEPLVDLWSALDEPYEVERFWSTTFGIDAQYEPLGVTLSGMLDLARDSGDVPGTKTFLFTLGYNLH